MDGTLDPLTGPGNPAWGEVRKKISKQNHLEQKLWGEIPPIVEIVFLFYKVIFFAKYQYIYIYTYILSLLISRQISP